MIETSVSMDSRFLIKKNVSSFDLNDLYKEIQISNKKRWKNLCA